MSPGQADHERLVCRRAVVHGDVQGVFFRDSTQREARSRGVAGWVRNCEDGTVEALLEGGHDQVEELVGWLQHGPPRASVARVEVADSQPQGSSGFEIR